MQNDPKSTPTINDADPFAPFRQSATLYDDEVEVVPVTTLMNGHPTRVYTIRRLENREPLAFSTEADALRAVDRIKWRRSGLLAKLEALAQTRAVAPGSAAGQPTYAIMEDGSVWFQGERIGAADTPLVALVEAIRHAAAQHKHDVSLIRYRNRTIRQQSDGTFRLTHKGQILGAFETVGAAQAAAREHADQTKGTTTPPSPDRLAKAEAQQTRATPSAPAQKTPTKPDWTRLRSTVPDPTGRVIKPQLAADDPVRLGMIRMMERDPKMMLFYRRDPMLAAVNGFEPLTPAEIEELEDTIAGAQPKAGTPYTDNLDDVTSWED